MPLYSDMDDRIRYPALLVAANRHRMHEADERGDHDSEEDQTSSHAGTVQPTSDDYRLWVAEDGMTLVRLWDNGVCEVARRGNSYETWGPPIKLNEEKT